MRDTIAALRSISHTVDRETAPITEAETDASALLMAVASHATDPTLRAALGDGLFGTLRWIVRHPERGIEYRPGCRGADHLEFGNQVDAICALLTQLMVRAMPERPADDDPIARAIGYRSSHPEWTDKRVARAAGCSPSTLSRCAQYQAVRQAAIGIATRPPRGHRTREGGVEAYDD